MRLILLIVFYLLSASFVHAQKNKEKKNSYNFSVNFGMGLTKFDISGFDTEDYPAMASRLGVGISKTVIGRFQVESGINLYFRAKSKSPLKDEIYWYGKGSILPTIHDTATQPHFAFEVPISLGYILKGNRSVSTGLLLRKWGPKDETPVSHFATKAELGYTLGLNQKVLQQFTIGLDIFIGFKDFYPGNVIGSSGDIVVKNRSALLSLSYAL